MESNFPTVHFELITVIDGVSKQDSIVEVSDFDGLNTVYDKILGNEAITLVTLTLPDDVIWELGREEAFSFLVESLKSGRTYHVYLTDDMGEGTLQRHTTDFSEVVSDIRLYGSDVVVSITDTEGTELDNLDTTPFIQAVTHGIPELPVNKAVDFQEQRPTTREFGEKDKQHDPLAIQRESFENTDAVLNALSSLIDKLSDDEKRLQNLRDKQRRPVSDEEGSPWLRSLGHSQEHASIVGDGQRSLGRDEGIWRQQFAHEGRVVRTGTPVQKMNSGGHSRAEIAMYIERKRGGGVPFDLMLPRSGFWVRFRPPQLQDFVNLQYRLSQIKINVGNVTKGLAFSNMSQTLKSVVFDFCLEFVTASTCDYRTPTDLKEKVELVDQDLFFWGLACTIYPRGFPYSHSCVADPENCRHVVKEVLNLNNLLWLDMSSLSAKQQKMLAVRNWDKPTSDDELREYREDHRHGNKRIVWFSDGIGLELRVPSVYDYEVAGQSWIESLKEMTSSAYNEPPHGNSRSGYIETLAMASTACQYSHWVNGIYEQNDEGSEPICLGEDRDLIESILTTTFSTADDVETFFTEVSKFIDDCMIGVIAVPSYNCPSCDTPVANKFHERFPHLVALDVMSTFFTLHNRKLKD